MEGHVFQIGDFKTLPLYMVTGRLLEDIAPFSKGTVRIEYTDPEYEPPDYAPTTEWLNKVNSDPTAAIAMIRNWHPHLNRFQMFVQFKSDPSRVKIRRLYEHTQLASAVCDTRLHIDTIALWQALHYTMAFENVHDDYRRDPERNQKYQEYAMRQDGIYKELSRYQIQIHSLVERIATAINLKRDWITSGETHVGLDRPLSLFYSYSHDDEALRNELEQHLKIMHRQGLIESWHDRRIGAGKEWKSEIDENLENADVILFLISSSFVASDYCYDVEMQRAMERHETHEARVIPVILRACDWHSAPFGKLQAVPRDGLAVTSWSNRDEALYDAATQIRRAVEAIRFRS